MVADKEKIKNDFTNKLMAMYAEDVSEASMLHKYFALGSLIKEYASKDWMNSNKKYSKENVKQVYYFSMEFLLGRLLLSNLINMGIFDEVKDALSDLNIDIDDLEEVETDSGLGNGGLGRLAACFLDSMASLGIAGYGNGIRYKYGLFEQKIVNGYQVEVPDNWLKNGSVWETRKEEYAVEVKFGGKVNVRMENGRLRFSQSDYESVMAVPYDVPIVGYKNHVVNTLRLWSAEVEKDFDLSSFSSGNYLKAVEHKYNAEAISDVLYPDDSTWEGRKLRLKQEYFFVSAGLESIVRKYKKSKKPLKEFAKYNAVHINDTHPAVAVAELMRILIDEEGIEWSEAWEITKNTMAFTNHTIMAEALEKWPVDMFKKLLPRIYMIIEEIDRRFISKLKKQYPNAQYKLNNMRIISNGSIRMAYLAIVGSHSVNGVAKLHTKILETKELKDFYETYPEKFNNKTNGITHRRWLLEANPKLAELITQTIGDSWIKDPDRLIDILKFKDDASFRQKIYEIKKENKIRFAEYVKKKYNFDINPESMYDVQVKRLHAYKRQTLNVFHIMDLYKMLKDNPNLDIVPRTFIFGAKAAPSYKLAKEIIKLINTVADRVNNDKSINGKIKVLFLENYRVSLAELVIPSADVSEQISTTTKEASGTGNMKLMMNGAVTIATPDGANIEIKDAVGDDNIVMFGLNAQEVLNYQKNGGYHSIYIYKNDSRINSIINSLQNGSLGVPSNEFRMIYESLITGNDEFFVLKDFDAYVKAQQSIDNLYRQKERWISMSIENIAHSGIFSSDNTVREYAKEIWKL